MKTQLEHDFGRRLGWWVVLGAAAWCVLFLPLKWVAPAMAGSIGLLVAKFFVGSF